MVLKALRVSPNMVEIRVGEGCGLLLRFRSYPDGSGREKVQLLQIVDTASGRTFRPSERDLPRAVCQKSLRKAYAIFDREDLRAARQAHEEALAS